MKSEDDLSFGIDQQLTFSEVGGMELINPRFPESLLSFKSGEEFEAWLAQIQFHFGQYHVIWVENCKADTGKCPAASKPNIFIQEEKICMVAIEKEGKRKSRD